MATREDTERQDAVGGHGPAANPTPEQIDEAHARLAEGRQERTELDGQALIERAASSPSAVRGMDDQQRVDAMAWLLADDDDDVRTEKWEFNFGTEDAPVWVPWVIRPIDADSMNALREQSREGNRARRRATAGAPEINPTVFNLRMVATATVEPDLAAAAERRGIQSADPLYGPVELLKHRSRSKPGVIDQIAMKVMTLSGYDEDDARRAPQQTMVRAAGNS